MYLVFFHYICTQKTKDYAYEDEGKRAELRVWSIVREEFQLGSVSNITRLKTALVDKDIVEMSGKRYYITDPVFALWFRSRMF